MPFSQPCPDGCACGKHQRVIRLRLRTTRPRGDR